MRFTNDDWCFGCGENNPIGLRLRFDQCEEGVTGAFTPDRNHQGYRGMLHGGLIMTLLDEALAWAVTYKYGPGVTAELNVRIRHYGPVGSPLTITAKTGRKRMRMCEGEAKVVDASGAVIAEASGRFMLSDPKADESTLA
jgi:acyl-coenzyme A thioesterase PaaI-like protein